LLAIAGCGSKDEGYREFNAAETRRFEGETDEHDHHHHGDQQHTAPHGGHLLELGDHALHVEIVFDQATRKLTAYVLGPHAEEAVAVAGAGPRLVLKTESGESELTLKALPETSDPDGKSSRFELGADQLPASILHEEDLEGTLHLEVDGQKYDAVIEHDEHDHDHGDEHDRDDDHHEEK
jgi:hypothetical protein